MGLFSVVTIPEIVFRGEITIPYEILKYTNDDGSVQFDVECDAFESQFYFDSEEEAREWIEDKEN